MFTLIAEYLTNPLDVLVNQSAANKIFPSQRAATDTTTARLHWIVWRMG